MLLYSSDIFIIDIMTSSSVIMTTLMKAMSAASGLGNGGERDSFKWKL